MQSAPRESYRRLKRGAIFLCVHFIMISVDFIYFSYEPNEL